MLFRYLAFCKTKYAPKIALARGSSFDLSDVGMSVASACSSLGAAAFPPPRMKDYVLMEALGSGTYATVYKAVHKVQKALVLPTYNYCM